MTLYINYTENFKEIIKSHALIKFNGWYEKFSFLIQDIGSYRICSLYIYIYIYIRFWMILSFYFTSRICICMDYVRIMNFVCFMEWWICMRLYKWICLDYGIHYENWMEHVYMDVQINKIRILYDPDGWFSFKKRAMLYL